jgi:cell wall-associated NlpC family hydrolase
MQTGCSSSPERSGPAGATHDGLAEAARMVGRPYRYGGTGPNSFDCSGLVYYAYRKAGIPVPRTTRDQYRHAEHIPVSGIRPGDLLFFRIHSRGISHVAIYAGQGRIIHAPSSGGQVTYGELDSPYWRQRLAAAGRYE